LKPVSLCLRGTADGYEAASAKAKADAVLIARLQKELAMFGMAEAY
jgi:hypothetical protein